MKIFECGRTGSSPVSGEGGAHEEWIRAHAQLVRAKAGEIGFGRVERAWLLGCVVVLAGVWVGGLIVGDDGLVLRATGAISALQAVAWAIRRRGGR